MSTPILNPVTGKSWAKRPDTTCTKCCPLLRANCVRGTFLDAVIDRACPLGRRWCESMSDQVRAGHRQDQSRARNATWRTPVGQAQTETPVRRMLIRPASAFFQVAIWGRRVRKNDFAHVGMRKCHLCRRDAHRPPKSSAWRRVPGCF